MRFPHIDASLPWLLTYTHNFALAEARDFTNLNLALGHFWSLAVEEQFYLFWPALVADTTLRSYMCS